MAGKTLSEIPPMSAAELTAIAGVIAAIIAGIGLAAAAIYRIGKLSEATARIPVEMKIELQRIHDRIVQHEVLNGEQLRHNEELIHRVVELVRIEAERTREQIRNLHQAIMSHSHDEDGSVMFRVPPPESDQQ